ncbi:hypothetical protein NF212_25345 (plasmid) [Parasalinivibrio latis]|uniref:hypothetical protein n=1 Tax=Parasalinivibrio latis TaxID=2952610 RepID=UPI0030E48EBF
MSNTIDSTQLDLITLGNKNQKNNFIVNPRTGRLSFGRIPPNNLGVAEGEIYLKLGYIGFGPQKKGAYGARHIWEKHQIDLNLGNPQDIAVRLLDIMAVGVDILVDFSARHNPARPVILNTSVGRVALTAESKQGVPCYSIVSAYGARNAPGTVIGTLKKPSD